MKGLLQPESLAVIVLTWMGSHAEGIGEVVDVIGIVMEGLQFKAVLEDLWDYATIAVAAQTSAELDQAGQKFADAVVAVGIMKLAELVSELGGEGEGGKPSEREGGETTKEGDEEGPAAEEEELPEEVAAVCVIGSLTCSVLPESALEQAGQPPHLDRVPFPEGPWELRGKGDSVYEGLRREDTLTRNQKYLERPDLWTPEFRAAYEQAGNEFPDDWQVHHKKPISFGGDNSVENFVALERPIHADITSYWTTLRAAIAEPFGGLGSAKFKKIVGGEVDVQL